MLLVGCYWVCLCHIIVGESTLHDVISAAASVDDTTGGNNNNNNATNDKKQMTGDDSMPFHWPPPLLNQQHRSFSSFSGQGVQIHTSKRKPDDPDVGVLVRILRSATKAEKPAAAKNAGAARLMSSPSTGRRRRIVKKTNQRHRRNIISADDDDVVVNNNNNKPSLRGGDSEKSFSPERGRLVQKHRFLLLRKPRSSAAITKNLVKAPLSGTAQDANRHDLDQLSTIPLQYIIVVVSVPACIVFLFVTLFSYSFFN